MAKVAFIQRIRPIDPKAPLETVALFVRDRFEEGVPPIPTLHFWQSEFYRWTGRRYETMGRDLVRSHLYDWAAQQLMADTGLPCKPDRRLVDDLLDALRAIAVLSVRCAPAWIVKGPTPIAAHDMIACANGLLQVPRRQLHHHAPVLFNLNALPFAYDPDAPAPTRWQTFLCQLWPEDTESIAALAEWFGLALTQDTSQQKALLLIGPKRAGKGVIARVLRALVGADNVCSPTLASLGQPFGLQSLIGRQLAIISDARLGGRSDLAAIAENLLRITGEDAISVSRKYLSDWVGRLGARFMLLTNELPALFDASGALASRFIVLRLVESFYGREDPALTEALFKELPGIFNWALAGLDRLQARKRLTQPTSAAEMIEELDRLGSPMRAFLADRCVVKPGASVECALLFEEWCLWCKEQHRESGTRQMFGKNLSAAAAALKVVSLRRPEGRQRWYDGIEIAR
jgi:putative DNA primase/helicase